MTLVYYSTITRTAQGTYGHIGFSYPPYATTRPGSSQALTSAEMLGFRGLRDLRRLGVIEGSDFGFRVLRFKGYRLGFRVEGLKGFRVRV